MTLQEVCLKLNIAESSITTNFARTQKKLLKQNIKLIKDGRGASAVYDIEYLTDNRALSLYDEVRDDIVLTNDSVKLPNWEFLVFLAIVTTPMFVFRGSYEDFLNYVQIKINNSNLQYLKEALESLEQRDIINYIVDKTNKNYFIAGIYRKVEEDMKIGIEMVKECKRLQEKYNKQSFVPLLKTWIGVQMLIENQPFTTKDLINITGLSEYSVRESHKILKESNIYKSSKAYGSIEHCVGLCAELNAFYNS
jgi:hypothetical protein